ncbi:MAG: hypothetical protein MJZ12_01630 [Prevotella sp.]|nr:hypothetical protein [Prevotella sp.]
MDTKDILERMILNCNEDRHMATRDALRSISSKEELINIIDRAALSEEEEYIIREHYLEHRNLSVIADFIGYSISSTKRKHKDALAKICGVL